MIARTSLRTPIGTLLIEGNDDVITTIHLPGTALRATTTSAAAVLSGVQQLEEYFARERRDFDLPLAPTGTAFQQAVWRALTTIPYGTTQTYGDVARRVGRPKAFRAVGTANGANPYPVVVPCHRVVASSGLGGYAGGLRCKIGLLNFEGATWSDRTRRDR